MHKPPIYALLLSVIMVTAPHFDHLPAWVNSLCVILFVWRAYITYTHGTPPKRWLLAIITLSCTAGIVLTFSTVFGRDAGVTMLILLTALKMLELHSSRDAMVLIHLSCFIVITQFFYSQSVLTGVYMLLTLLAIVAAWIQLRNHSIALRPRLKITLTLLLQALPLTLLLFVLFPRIPGPLWGMPQDAFARTGLDDKIALGSISKVSQSDEVAFRVSFNDAVPQQEQMYWRGPVMWDFDGNSWTTGATNFATEPRFTNLTQPINYVVTLEPHNKNWLFALDVPGGISIPAKLSADFRILHTQPITERIRYQARSFLSYTANVAENEILLQRALRFPSINPRTQQLAGTWRKQAKNNEEIVQRALQYFNKQGFVYTLEPPQLGQNAIDDFLFNTRKGFCEHYSTAFVFMMRAANVPARVVAGYQGGEYNDIGKYYIVRQSDAHAWAEVWLEGKGWVRVDPTAAIAPTRIRAGVSAAVSNNAALPYMSRNPPQWLLSLRRNWDAMANQWNQWVLGYNTERQFAFLTKLGMESVSWQKMAINMLLLLGATICALVLFMLRHILFNRPDAIHRYWQKLSQKLSKIGLARYPHEGALAYAQRVATNRPDLAEAMLDIAHCYNRLRYQNLVNEQAIREFVKKTKMLKVSKIANVK